MLDGLRTSRQLNQLSGRHAHAKINEVQHPAAAPRAMHRDVVHMQVCMDVFVLMQMIQGDKRLPDQVNDRVLLAVYRRVPEVSRRQ